MATENQYAVNPYAAPQAELARDAGEEEFQQVRLFAVSGRMGRIRYLANMMGLYILTAIIVGIMAAGVAGLGLRDTTAILVVMGLGYAGMFVLFTMMAIQRCHDFDRSGWWVLLFIVPLVNALFGLYLIFMPGTDGRNRFGSRTPPNSTLSVILACLFPVLIVIGIVAAVALPAYDQYTRRARMESPR